MGRRATEPQTDPNGLSGLFGAGGRPIRPRVRRRAWWGKDPPPSEDELLARRILAVVWPTVRRATPTPEEISKEVWSMGLMGPYVGPRPPLLFVNEGEMDDGTDLIGPHSARWDGNAIMYDMMAWRRLPHRRVQNLVHEGLHAVGFVHYKRGTAGAYSKVVRRTMQAIPPGRLLEARRLARFPPANARVPDWRETPDTIEVVAGPEKRGGRPKKRKAPEER